MATEFTDAQGVTLGKGQTKGKISSQADPIPDRTPPKEKGPAQMTLPELMADAIRKVSEDPHNMPAARKSLYIWWMAQPLDDKREDLRKIVRNQLEQGSRIMQGLMSEFQEMK